MRLLIAMLKAEIHGFFYLHRLCYHRQMTGFIWSIWCFDCGKHFYQFNVPEDTP